jgi:hypothetical protein
MVMIYIDFQGGAHGNYLEFVCNKFLANVKTDGDPFNNLGASHSKNYLSEKMFSAWHYFEYCGKKTIIENSKILSIQIVSDDLLPLSMISLLRAGDYNIDNNQLEINTYNKWNNVNYKWVLENLLNGFFQAQIQKSYNAVKDDSWPPVSNFDDFKNLPQWIQDECTNVHNLQLFELTAESPDCPRYILREFFKLSFKYPEQSGFMTQQQKMTYNDSNDVWIFPFACFYDINLFRQELAKIAHWSGYSFLHNDAFYELHNKFLQNQPYKNSKKFCDQLLRKIHNSELFEIPKLDLLQESYLTAHIELQYNVELPNTNAWFVHSQEIFEIINL